MKYDSTTTKRMASPPTSYGKNANVKETTLADRKMGGKKGYGGKKMSYGKRSGKGSMPY